MEAGTDNSEELTLPSVSDLNRSPEDMNPWPFDQPKNCAVFTTTHVLKEGRDIAFVFHDADDHGWQFHYEGEKSIGDSMVVCLSDIVQHDPTVLEVADLPPGWKAWRKKRGDAWQRAENPSEEEDDPAGTDNDRAAPGRV